MDLGPVPHFRADLRHCYIWLTSAHVTHHEFKWRPRKPRFAAGKVHEPVVQLCRSEAREIDSCEYRVPRLDSRTDAYCDANGLCCSN